MIYRKPTCCLLSITANPLYLAIWKLKANHFAIAQESAWNADFNSTGLGCGLRPCISNWLPGETLAVGLWITKLCYRGLKEKLWVPPRMELTEGPCFVKAASDVNLKEEQIAAATATLPVFRPSWYAGLHPQPPLDDWVWNGQGSQGVSLWLPHFRE